ncbi:MAG: hypothetical protein HZB53_00090 [Chloroflexi bacterium]|nr:hypothetical protein [Chloroflexota bacterium]
MAINITAVRDGLTAAGYEVTVGAGVRGRKSRQDTMSIDISVDTSGRVRFSSSRVTEPPSVSAAARRGITVTRENRRVTTIIYTLAPEDDVLTIVREMERLERG